MQEQTKLYGIECYLRPSDDDQTPLAEYIANLESDITRAIMADPRMGGLALNCEMSESALLSDDEGLIAGILVQFSVTFRTMATNPTQF